MSHWSAVSRGMGSTNHDSDARLAIARALDGAEQDGEWSPLPAVVAAELRDGDMWCAGDPLVWMEGGRGVGGHDEVRPA